MIYRPASLVALFVLGGIFAAPPVHAAPGRLAGNGSRELTDGRHTVAAPEGVVGSTPVLRTRPWQRLEAEVGTAIAAWSRQTLVPSRILLEGVGVPGAVADPTTAAAFARDFLERHLDLLAPGSSLGDFVLVTNDLSHGIRTVGFAQRHNGVPVLGGQVSLRFKFDRLLMIGSEAYPDVAVPSRSRLVDTRTAVAQAKTWVQAGRAVTPKVHTPTVGPFVLPIAVAGAPTEYREVLAVELDVPGRAERWAVYVDAETGAPVAREQTLLFGSSTMLYNVPDRHPLSARTPRPARQTEVGTSGGPVLTSPTGVFVYPGAADSVAPGLESPFVSLQNAAGSVPLASLPATDGTTTVWDLRDDPQADAALSAYIHAGIAKDFVRQIAPDLAWLDDQIRVTVNIDDSCNAFSDGDSINFFQSSEACQNTGLLSDVVYHELAHSVHTQSVLPGVGQFNVALSEGISDYLASTITNDSGLGRGFFFSDEPLRDFDPPGFEYRWPEDRGAVHDEGRIIGGALWDLRKLMIVDLGEVQGRSYTDSLWYESIRRAVDIPSMYPEALLFDDDDGNLANGTPRGCLINEAYGPHGLFSAGEGNETVSVVENDGLVVNLSLSIPNFPGCPVSASPEVVWRLREQPGGEITFPMAAGQDGTYSATIPPQTPGQVLQYRVRPNYSTGGGAGGGRSLPDNIVDPWYEYFFGEVTQLRCITDPTWTSAAGGDGNNWIVGPWNGDDHATDPTGPFDANTHAFQQGKYAPFADTTLTFDPVATGGNTNIRLQYYRWLSVEDGFFDAAFIRANGATVWQNVASADESQASLHHVDKEWRFHDVDLSAFASDGEIQLEFAQVSDGGLEFGGWSMAQVCVVAFDAGATTCGDGIVDVNEECDDGNIVDGDGCTALCTLDESLPPPTTTGDPTTDSDSSGEGGTDSGFETDSDGDTETDTDGDTDGSGQLLTRGCGGCDTGGDAPSPLWLGMFGLGLLGFARRGGFAKRHYETRKTSCSSGSSNGPGTTPSVAKTYNAVR